jgi:CubicO group peptidase (beta-lactamase class C family)
LPDPALTTTLYGVDRWPVDHVAVGVIRHDALVATHGAIHRVFRLASISKMLTAWAVLVAVEEGTVSLDDPAGPPGATLRHLLAHAAGYGFDTAVPITRPGRNRIYSNTGIEVAAAHVAEHAGMPFADYVRDAVFVPLGMSQSELRGSPAHGVHSTVADLAVFAVELLHPRLVSLDTAQEAATVQYPELNGVVPGVGSFRPNPWGLGLEIRGTKNPHWTGTLNSPRTFGHFGGSGTMLWVDPTIDTALVALTDRPFDQWSEVALREWPALSDAVVTWATQTL